MAIDLPTELTDLRRAILTMGATVEQRLNTILIALRSHDVELARTIRHGDRPIDEMELGIEKKCLHILALSQPVAGDLRFILAVLRINTDLERIGDLAKGIAKRVLDLSRQTAIPLPGALLEMSERCGHMTAVALSALADNDATACGRIREEDERIDALHKQIFTWVHQEIPRHVDHTEAAIDVLTIARSIERVADHACSIAEDVVFVVEGTVVRHGGM